MTPQPLKLEINLKKNKRIKFYSIKLEGWVETNPSDIRIFLMDISIKSR
jgi:hypothetical protein